MFGANWGRKVNEKVIFGYTVFTQTDLLTYLFCHPVLSYGHLCDSRDLRSVVVVAAG